MVAALASALGVADGWAQVSPGPLSKAHADMDGNLGCAKCHGKGEGVMDQKCLACHKEIATLISKGRGFHAREGKKNCAHCHPDHGGRDFALVAWPDKTPEKFDHARTGWKLDGKHATLECRQCHSPAHMTGEAASLAKNRDHAWVGLDSNCKSCHDDVHKGALGADCKSCHSTAAWRPVPRFDHARTKFPLTGRHAKVACASCHEAANLTLAHTAKGEVIPLYKPLPHDECSACHADAHKGAFGPTCSRCHTTVDFHVVEAGHFDHDRTRYPLRGKHATLACAVCHDEKTAWGRKPAFATCGGCHKDPHAGQATLAGNAVDCASCHAVSGFAPSTFTVVMHARTHFPLEAAHASADCMKCHGRKPAGSAAQVTAALGGAGVWFHPKSGRCVDCHRDPHEGRFSPGGERARSEDCVACHDLAHFRPSRMDAAAHEHSRFPLQGAHRAVPCVACHSELGTAQVTSAGAQSLLMRVDKRACRDCHESPHGNQFDRRKDGGACENCHDMDSFAPASRFDHAKGASFTLEGHHKNVPCGRCHPTVTPAGGKAMVLYRPVSSRCESCHAEDGGTRGG